MIDVVFCDIDGVLHPQYGQVGSSAAILMDWLRQKPEVRIVISSSWRESHAWSKILALFPQDLHDRVIGSTPLFRKLPNYVVLAKDGLRQAEVLAWLMAHRESHGVRGWAVLDDDSSLFSANWPKLIVCNPRNGIEPKGLDELERVLAAQRA